MIHRHHGFIYLREIKNLCLQHVHFCFLAKWDIIKLLILLVHDIQPILQALILYPQAIQLLYLLNKLLILLSFLIQSLLHDLVLSSKHLNFIAHVPQGSRNLFSYNLRLLAKLCLKLLYHLIFVYNFALLLAQVLLLWRNSFLQVLNFSLQLFILILELFQHLGDLLIGLRSFIIALFNSFSKFVDLIISHHDLLSQVIKL